MSRTALSEEKIPGWYVEFQAAVLRQLPRPGEILAVHGKLWTKDQGRLKSKLHEALVDSLNSVRGNIRVPHSADKRTLQVFEKSEEALQYAAFKCAEDLKNILLGARIPVTLIDSGGEVIPSNRRINNRMIWRMVEGASIDSSLRPSEPAPIFEKIKPILDKFTEVVMSMPHNY